MEKVKGNDSQSLLFRLIRELDGDGEKVLQALLNYLPKETKNELICQCLNSYGATLTRKLNEYLQTDTWGKNFTIGSCYAAKQETGLVLVAEQVHADYTTLLMEAGNAQRVAQTARRFTGDGILGRLAARAAAAAAEQLTQNYSSMSQEALETAAIGLLNQPMVQGRIQSLISRALKAKELDITVGSLTIEQTAANSALDNGNIIDNIHFSQELESALLKALADFLREKL